MLLNQVAHKESNMKPYLVGQDQEPAAYKERFGDVLKQASRASEKELPARSSRAGFLRQALAVTALSIIWSLGCNIFIPYLRDHREKFSYTKRIIDNLQVDTTIRGRQAIISRQKHAGTKRGLRCASIMTDHTRLPFNLRWSRRSGRQMRAREGLGNGPVLEVVGNGWVGKVVEPAWNGRELGDWKKGWVSGYRWWEVASW